MLLRAAITALWPTSQLAVVSVTQGQRYRIRLASMLCDPNFIFTIDGHDMTMQHYVALWSAMEVLCRPVETLGIHFACIALGAIESDGDVIKCNVKDLKASVTETIKLGQTSSRNPCRSPRNVICVHLNGYECEIRKDLKASTLRESPGSISSTGSSGKRLGSISSFGSMRVVRITYRVPIQGLYKFHQQRSASLSSSGSPGSNCYQLLLSLGVCYQVLNIRGLAYQATTSTGATERNLAKPSFADVDLN
ncbi:hypothetical protein C8R45DRAFT_943464 [Mycena sanguinolenta]|nr:hypothetical protein C8R45DRAFT_943464 [Mycena sanguinolenta]